MLNKRPWKATGKSEMVDSLTWVFEMWTIQPKIKFARGKLNGTEIPDIFRKFGCPLFRKFWKIPFHSLGNQNFCSNRKCPCSSRTNKMVNICCSHIESHIKWFGNIVKVKVMTFGFLRLCAAMREMKRRFASLSFNCCCWSLTNLELEWTHSFAR